MATPLQRTPAWRMLACLLPITIAACGGSGETPHTQPVADSASTSTVPVQSAPAETPVTAPQAPPPTAPVPTDTSTTPATPPAAPAPSDTNVTPDAVTISTSVLGSTLTLSTQPRFAGAIASLRFRGQEYINTTDHGRLMQSASSFDHYGECYNPTEGGNRDDSDKNSTTSTLLRAAAGDHWLETETDMAFWLAPGTDYGQYCGDRTDTRMAVNTSLRANHVLAKRVVIGAAGKENVIGYFAQYKVPEPRSSAVFEAATVYTPKSFNKRLVFDPNSGALSLTDHFGEQALPVILATADEQHAIALFSPDLPRDGAGYGTFNFWDTNKINCVFRVNGVQAGGYRYRCFFAVGSLHEVVQTLKELDASRLAIGWQ